MSDTSIVATTPATGIQAIRTPAIPEMEVIERIGKMAQMAALSGFVNSTRNDKDGRMADAFFVMMQGIEIGIPPMTALRTIHVISGKPAISGQALLSLMRRAGVEVIIQDPSSIKDKSTIKLRRPNETEWHEVSFTQHEAEKAGLWGKNIWKQYPSDMLTWRAVSRANRLFTSDITGGLYTIEEFQTPEMVLNADGEIVAQLTSDKQPPPPAAPQLPATVAHAQEQDEHETNEPPPAAPQELSMIEKLQMFIIGEFKKIDGITLDWLKISELAKAKVANPDDFDSWKAAGFKSFAEAFAFIRAEYTKPATPKQNPFSKDTTPQAPAQQPTPAWIEGLDESTFWDGVERGFFGYDKNDVLKALNVQAITDIATPQEATAQLNALAAKSCWRLIATSAKYVGGKRKHIELSTALGTVITFTRDPFRQMGEDWKTYVETWEEGKTYTFTDAGLPVVVVDWKWAGEANPIMTVGKLQSLAAAIPF